MILDHTNKLRQYVNILPYDKWPTELNARTNCLAFQLGLAIDLGKDYLDLGRLFSTRISVNDHKSFLETYEQLLTELNFEWRRISRPDDANDNEYIFQIYGPFHYDDNLYYDFHAIRRELDGTWVHKTTFGSYPEIIEWKCFSIIYPRSSILGTYAVKKKTP